MARAPRERTAKMEYKSLVDRAWYAVSLDYGRPRGRAAYFNIRYTGVLPREEVEVVDLNVSSKVKEVTRNFRALSRQLQDPDCCMVHRGMRICASYRRHGDLRYYDAIVIQVKMTLIEG